MLFIYALYIPLGTLVIYNLVSRSGSAKHEATYLSFSITIMLTFFLTTIIKNAVGRPRPDLLDRCQPSADAKADVLVSILVCTSPHDEKLQDGWRSFPSGHSSFSFAGLGFLSLFLAGQLHVFRPLTGGRDLCRALIFLIPLIGASMIAISRCEDYRHDVYDVCVGSTLGIIIAYWSYRRHWPKLSSHKCDEPHPRPGMEAQLSEWRPVRDEEEAGTIVANNFEREASHSTETTR